jgi:hypothetical protein
VATESVDLLAQFRGAFEGAIRVVAAYGTTLRECPNGFGRVGALPVPRGAIKEALFVLYAVLRRPELREVVCQQYPEGAGQIVSGELQRGVTAGILALPNFLADEDATLIFEFLARGAEMPEERLLMARGVLERCRQEAATLLAEGEVFRAPPA